MAKSDGMFLYIGTYPDEAAARADYDIVKDLTPPMSSAPTTPRSSRRSERQDPRQQGRDGDPARRLGRRGSRRRRRHPVPPCRPRQCVVGGAVGGVSGHLWRGMSRSDVKELGELIDAGQAALVVVGESNLEEALDKAELKAEKHVAKQVDVSSKDVDAAVKEAAGQVG